MFVRNGSKFNKFLKSKLRNVWFSVTKSALFSYHELLIRLLSSFCVALCEVALLTASTAAAAAKMAA